MAQKTRQSSFDPRADMGTDYVLIATATAAALVALVYLILI
jgi:hypothetical protein